MGTPLYNTDVIPMTSRPTLTVMEDGDYFAILDTSTGKISKILKTNLVLPASKVSYNNSTSELTATQVQAALDELVVNLGSSDSAISALGGRLDILEADESTEGSVAYDIKQSSDALKGIGYTEGSLKTHEDRLDILEGADTETGSVLKSIKDNAKDATITYTLASALAELASGESLTVIMGKLAKANSVVLAQLDGKSSFRGTLVAADGDLNSLTLTGAYTCYGTTANAPFTEESCRIYHFNSNANTTTAGQVGWGYTTGKFKFRIKVADTYSAWSTGVSPTELGYLSGVTSNVQDQMEALKVADTTLSTSLDAVKVKTTENDLAIQAIQRDQNLANQSEAKISLSDYGIVALPKNATGNLKMKREGLTARNIVNGASIAIGGTVTFASVLNDIYYDVLNKVQITGTGSDIVVTNDSGAIANMAIINLTQTFSSIPTLAQCKNIFPTYFADTKNVPMTGRYRGRGKNLFDGNNSVDNWDYVTKTFLKESDGYFKLYSTGVIYSPSFYLPVGNITFSLTGKAVNGPSYGVYLVDSNNAQVGTTKYVGAGESRYTQPVSIGSGGYYKLAITLGTSGAVAWFKDIQLELGSPATPYEPYESHDLYLTAPEGRSVPSAKDSVEVQDGKLVHVKRVSDSVAVSSGVAVNVTNYPLAKTGGNFRVELTAGGVQIGVIGTDSTSGAGNLTYELATPITTPIDQDGAIPAGASVLWEPAIPDVGIYSTKFDILDTTHPIASIDKLYKVDFATDVQTLLTDAVIAGDGLSFTSASLASGDLVNVIYFYSVANPEGLTTAEYLNSNVVVADSANGKYYKYKPVVTNGAIASWTLTEVV